MIILGEIYPGFQHISYQDFTARTLKTTRTELGKYPHVTSMSKNLELSVEPNVVHMRHATLKKASFVNAPLYYVVRM